MNGRQTQTETNRADRGKAICPHLGVQRGNIIRDQVSKKGNNSLKCR